MYYSILNQNNPHTQQLIQHDKETFIKNKIVNILVGENLTKYECERIFKKVMESI